MGQQNLINSTRSQIWVGSCQKRLGEVRSGQEIEIESGMNKLGQQTQYSFVPKFQTGLFMLGLSGWYIVGQDRWSDQVRTGEVRICRT